MYDHHGTIEISAPEQVQHRILKRLGTTSLVDSDNSASDFQTSSYLGINSQTHGETTEVGPKGIRLTLEAAMFPAVNEFAAAIAAANPEASLKATTEAIRDPSQARVTSYSGGKATSDRTEHVDGASKDYSPADFGLGEKTHASVVEARLRENKKALSTDPDAFILVLSRAQAEGKTQDGAGKFMAAAGSFGKMSDQRLVGGFVMVTMRYADVANGISGMGAPALGIAYHLKAASDASLDNARQVNAAKRNRLQASGPER